MSSTRTDLAARLRDLDGRSYGNYKQITGRYRFGPVTVFIDRVQVDPFASPSKVRVRIDRAEAGFPTDITTDGADRIAVAAFLLRTGTKALPDLGQRASILGRPGPESLDRTPLCRAAADFPTVITTVGADRIAVADFLLRTGTKALADLGQRAIILGRPGQEILERTNVRIDDDGFEARLLVNLPAKGRRILGRQAADILTRNVPELARTMFLHSGLDAEALRQHVQLHRDQLELRSRLGDEGLVAFVGNDAILPRRSGDSDLPMDSAAVPFRSPDSL